MKEIMYFLMFCMAIVFLQYAIAFLIIGFAIYGVVMLVNHLKEENNELNSDTGESDRSPDGEG